MKNRWQQSLVTAETTTATPMPWARGDRRNAMISRRRARHESSSDPVEIVAQTA